METYVIPVCHAALARTDWVHLWVNSEMTIKLVAVWCGGA